MAIFASHCIWDLIKHRCKEMAACLGAHPTTKTDPPKKKKENNLFDAFLGLPSPIHSLEFLSRALHMLKRNLDMQVKCRCLKIQAPKTPTFQKSTISRHFWGSLVWRHSSFHIHRMFRQPVDAVVLQATGYHLPLCFFIKQWRAIITLLILIPKENT